LEAHKSNILLHYIFIVLGAIEKQKLVYILNRDAKACLIISSPLTFFENNTLVYHTVDIGFKNPMFAYLEINYTGPQKKNVRFREADQHILMYFEPLNPNPS